MNADELRSIYVETLERCRPSLLVRRLFDHRPELAGRLHSAPVISMGKSAQELLRGARECVQVARSFVAIPAGYETGSVSADEVRIGSHPELSEASFRAGDALLDFISGCREPVLVLISGGSSACVEVALDPWFTPMELIQVNRPILRAGWAIESINTVRKHLSAIKGGRLGFMLPAGSVALVLSDVNVGRPELVGSGPTFADPSTNTGAAQLLETLGDSRLDGVVTKLRDPALPETPKSVLVENFTIGDNRTLVDAAARVLRQQGYSTRMVNEEIVDHVEGAAERLLEVALGLDRDTIAVAGGEPTVRVVGEGRGGRCSELAVRFARLARHKEVYNLVALFGSSDGRDGNTGAAGFVVSTEQAGRSEWDPRAVDQFLDASDTLGVVEKVGEAIIIPPTGNNLRDLFLLART